MPGIATLVNPAVPNGESIQLFYNTAHNNVGLLLQSGTNDDDPRKTFAAESNDQPGNIVNPSSIGAATYLGVNIAVGITKPFLKEGENYSNNDVAIISPVYRPLSTTTRGNDSLAFCSAGNKAWVYFLNGTDQDSTELREVRLDTVAAMNRDGITEIYRESRLAAYWDSDERQRYVIYQDNDTKRLYEFNVQDKDADNIKNTTDARPGTTMAVTYNEGKVFLYYTDDSFQLRRIIKRKNRWGSSSEVEGADKIDNSSHLSVSTSNGINHLFYVQRGQTEGNFTHVRDPIEEML